MFEVSPLNSAVSMPEVEGWPWLTESRLAPKFMLGNTAFRTKLGFFSRTNSQAAFSDKVLLAAYTGYQRSGSYGGSRYAHSTVSSFHVSVVTVNGLFGLGISAALEDDVNTKRLTLFSLAADSIASNVPLTVSGMTSWGLGFMVKIVAVCKTAETPASELDQLDVLFTGLPGMTMANTTYPSQLRRMRHRLPYRGRPRTRISPRHTCG